MTDSRADVIVSLRHRAAVVTPAAAAVLAGLARTMKTAARPAVRAWTRPSLRRRVGAALVIGGLAACVVAAGMLESIYNLFFRDGYVSCSGIQSLVPALPPQQPYCIYSPVVSVYSLIIMPAVFALTIWGCWLLAGWALGPLKDTAETVRRLGPQNLGQRIGLATGDDQFKELADAIDDALDRLAAGYESQRRFAANASHELRTPLAVQRLLTEVAMDDPNTGPDLRRLGTQLLRTNEHNEQLIEGMLTLAESDRGLQGKVPVRLDELAARVIDQHREQAAGHQLTLRRALSAATISGDPVLLERLIANLIGNAVKYNEPGGWIEVTVTPGPDGQGGALAVTNTGAPVPAEAVPILFEPFRRLGADRVRGRGGVGLGLAIVRSIVTAHQADLQARPRPGGGLEITIALPGR
ncbi:MAG TPA: HAMP domain-containing sensor histidine kinase [Trebonia sp.]|jgi:signal transduction histidine kinase|nr:HAMP domain-containing sensor histidine kinase [Trebonia sp.]